MHYTAYRCVSVVGGESLDVQASALRRGTGDETIALCSFFPFPLLPFSSLPCALVPPFLPLLSLCLLRLPSLSL